MKKIHFYAQIKLGKSYDGLTDKFHCVGIYSNLERAKRDTDYDFVIDVPADMVKKHLGTIIHDNIIKDGYCQRDEAEVMTTIFFPTQYVDLLKCF